MGFHFSYVAPRKATFKQNVPKKARNLLYGFDYSSKTILYIQEENAWRQGKNYRITDDHPSAKVEQ